jgi:hypothetical protein
MKKNILAYLPRKEERLRLAVLAAMLCLVAFSGGGRDLDLHGRRREEIAQERRFRDASEEFRRQPYEYVFVHEGGTSWLLAKRSGEATPFGDASSDQLLDLAASYKSPVSSVESLLKCVAKTAVKGLPRRLVISRASSALAALALVRSGKRDDVLVIESFTGSRHFVLDLSPVRGRGLPAVLTVLDDSDVNGYGARGSAIAAARNARRKVLRITDGLRPACIASQG